MTNSVFDTHDALGLAELVRTKEVSASELLDEAIARVESVDATLHLTAYKYYDFAREQIARGLPDGPFSGVPFMRKDNGAEIAGLPSSSGTMLLKDAVSPATHVLAQRFMDSGLVVFGATKVPPFCITYCTSGAHYGACGNAWDPTLSPAGSSSGSGAVVGSGAIPMAHGNDGGGSLRVPAAWNGVFTVKPSRGRIPNGPVYTEIWLGFATEGVLTRSVRDCAAAIDVTRGREIGARYDAPRPARSYLEETQHECRPLRVAVMEKLYDGADYDPEYLAAVKDTAHLLESLGHRVEYGAPDIDIGVLDKALFKNVAVDIHAALKRFGEARGTPVALDEVEPLIQTIAKQGPGISGYDYAEINDISQEMAYNYDLFMQDFDVVLSPTTAMRPRKIGDPYKFENDFNAFMENQNKALCLTVVQNITGQPAMSVPLQVGADGFPIGMMFTARYGDEATLFSLAAQLERAKPWWNRRPQLGI